MSLLWIRPLALLYPAESRDLGTYLLWFKLLVGKMTTFSPASRSTTSVHMFKLLIPNQTNDGFQPVPGYIHEQNQLSQSPRRQAIRLDLSLRTFFKVQVVLKSSDGQPYNVAKTSGIFLKPNNKLSGLWVHRRL